MPSPLITLTTDFGTACGYVAAMKGAILSIAPAVGLIDLSHGIAPQDVRQAARLLDQAARYFPPGTIHVAVVDPGVGTPRRLLCIEMQDQRFVGPDNGIFSRIAQGAPPRRMIALENPRFWRADVSATFHGRDIMGPVAAHLALGVDPAELGPATSEIVLLDWPRPRIGLRSIEGEVEAVDTFGNLLTNIRGEDLPTGAVPRVTCRSCEVVGVHHAYGEAAAGELVALVGSTGELELAVVNGSAAGRLAGEQAAASLVGTAVKVAW